MPDSTSGWRQIFRFTSWSERSTPAELSTASVLMRPPLTAYSTRPRCVTPRLPPSAIARTRSADAFTRTASLCGSAISASLPGGRDVRADATVPEEVGVEREDGLLEALAAHRLGREAEEGLHLGRERDPLRRARDDCGAGRQHAR